jgi:hypothetical protein
MLIFDDPTSGMAKLSCINKQFRIDVGKRFVNFQSHKLQRIYSMDISKRYECMLKCTNWYFPCHLLGVFEIEFLTDGKSRDKKGV